MELGVLGPLTVDGAVTAMPRRDRVVLAALTVHAGEVVAADRLADALWGAQPPASWAKVVQGCIVRLRRVLGTSAIETVRNGYRLQLAADDVDAFRFERLLGRGRELLALDEPDRASFVLEEALNLWRGPALADLEEWEAGRAAARRLDDLRLDAEELQLEAALRVGRYQEVLGAARRRVEEVPLRERRWALLALAQYQSGQQAEALRTLHEVRTVLSRELGLDPGPDLTALEEAVLRHDPALAPGRPLREPRPTCPYRGLLPYDLGDADDFHGREIDITACRDRLVEARAVTVVGPSGSGKSSLVRAGLAARLQRDGDRVVVITPGVHPMDTLSGLPMTGRAPVLVVDQCEEVVGLCADQKERAEFFTALTAYAQRARLIVAIRADRLGDLTTHPGFTRLVERSLYLLNPMTPDDLRTAIEGPARGAGLRLEPGLVDLLVREVEGEPGALPLLSHALRATWERREASTLTVAGYRGTGGVRGAVAQSAEAVYEQVPADQRPALRDLLLRLVAPNPEGDPMRSRLPRRLLTGAPHNDRLIEILVAARLVTSDDGVLELAHEALVRAWPRLHDWLDEDSEGQRILRHLVVAADTWDSMDRPDSELYRGLRLVQALEWRGRVHPQLTSAESEFLDASKALADAEEQAAAEESRRQRRINRRLRALLAGVAALTVVALIATVIASNQGKEAAAQRNSAVRQRNEAVALSLAAAARDVSDTNAPLALALAAESSAATPTPLAQATGALLQARLAFDQSAAQPVREPLPGHVGAATSVAFGSGGDLLASGGADGLVRLWDAFSGHPVGGFALRHGASVTSVAFNPADSRLASLGNDGVVRLWRVLRGQSTRVGPRRGSGASSIAFRRDGLLAIGHRSGMVDVWEPSSNRLQRRIRGHGEKITSLAFNSDGRLLATASTDTHGHGIVRVFDAVSGHSVWSARRSAGDASSVTFSPHGNLLAAAFGSGDALGIVRLFNPRTGRPVGREIRADEGINAIAFGVHGRLLATAGGFESGGILQLWDVGTQRPVSKPLAAHTGQVLGVAFDRIGSLIATAGQEGNVRLWRLIGSQPPFSTLPTHATDVGPPAFSPDGGLLVTTGANYLQLWNPDNGEALGNRIAVPANQTGAVAFSPNGGLLVTASYDGAVGLWDPATGRRVRATLPRKPTRVLLGLSPKGNAVAYLDYSRSGPEDGTVQLWNPLTGQPLGKPLSHHFSALGPVATFSPDGALFATVERAARELGSTLRIWSTRTGLQARPPLHPTKLVQTMAFSHDGSRLAAFSGTDVRIWRPGVSKVGTPLAGNTGPVNAIAFDRQGDLLATAGADATLRLWDVANGDPLGAPLTGHDTNLFAVTFSPRGKLLVTVAYDGTVRLWRWDITGACRLASRYLSRSQLRPYVPSNWTTTCQYPD